MALEIFKQLRRKLSGSTTEEVIDIERDSPWALSSEICVRELAFYACVNLIGNAVAKCEFKTFLGGKEVKGDEYYLWNYSPNKNQNSSEFLRKLIYRLYHDNEVLVVESGGQLLVADSFVCDRFAVKESVFTQVTVEDFTFNRSFRRSQVIYLNLGEKKLQTLVNSMNEAYGRLLDYGIKGYKKSRGTKGTLEIDTTASGDKVFQENISNLRNAGFRTFAEAENGILPIYKGLKFTETGKPSAETTRDIRAMIDDVFDLTARAFGIPPLLVSGQVAGISDALDQLLTFTIDPLTDMLSEEINRIRNGAEGFKQGNYLQIDTSTIKHIDKISSAQSIDKLISSGAYCINEMRIALGDPVIDEPWAWQHFITKNYEEIEQALDSLKGGESE